MNWKWHTVYSYFDRDPGGNDLFIVCIAIILLAIGTLGLLSKNRHKFLPFGVTGVSPYGFIIFAAAIFLANGYFQYSRYRLNADYRIGKCVNYEGQLNRILPRSGGGEMQFELSGRVFRYDSHHIALHEQLCDRGGPPVCVGDGVRVCLHSAQDGEILKIERRIPAATTNVPSLAPSTPSP